MLRRTYLLNRLVGPRDIVFLVGRHPIVYVRVVVVYLGLLVFAFLLYKLLITTFPSATIITVIFAIVSGILYISGIFFLLRSYFDVIVGSKDFLYVVWRDSFFKYHLKILTWSSIQDISVTPAGALGAVLSDSNILIATKQDEIIEFGHVYKADEVAQKAYALRDASLFQEDEDDEPIQDHLADDEKFKVLVETLGEVIVDYMKKKDD